jgi:hypothetical protein
VIPARVAKALTTYQTTFCVDQRSLPWMLAIFKNGRITAEHDGGVQRETRLGTIPFNEFIHGMLIRTAGL